MTLLYRHIMCFLVGIACMLAVPTNLYAGGKKAVAADSITVYVFLSESCPICQTLTLELKQVYSQYKGKGIAFVGLFPNKGMSTDESVKKFANKYSIPFDLKVDEKQKMAKRFEATTTPQVFVVNNKTGKVLYKGMADNHFEDIGKRRTVVTEHYLQNALSNILQNQPIDPAETKAVGCFIIK